MAFRRRVVRGRRGARRKRRYIWVGAVDESQAAFATFDATSQLRSIIAEYSVGSSTFQIEEQPQTRAYLRAIRGHTYVANHSAATVLVIERLYIADVGALQTEVQDVTLGSDWLDDWFWERRYILPPTIGTPPNDAASSNMLVRASGSANVTPFDYHRVEWKGIRKWHKDQQLVLQSGVFSVGGTIGEDTIEQGNWLRALIEFR